MRKISLFIAILLLVSFAASAGLGDLFLSQKGNVALIDLSGTISPSSAGLSAGITPEDVRELNEKAVNRNADAIIYEINSGGGAVVASKDIRRNIEALEVPTVCRIRDVGASGAYLISLGCDSIVADSASTTGSIGVTSSYIEFSDLMEELGADYVNITAGERKEIGSPFQEPSEEEKELLREKAQLIGDEFLSEVSESRNLTQAQKEEVGTGEIFLGSEARDLGLIDELGGRSVAIEEAENITEKKLSLVRIDKTSSFSLLDVFVPGLEIGVDNSPLRAVM